MSAYLTYRYRTRTVILKNTSINCFWIFGLTAVIKLLLKSLAFFSFHFSFFPGKAVESLEFEQQPAIQLMVVGADIPAVSLKSEVKITAHVKTTINMAQFSGTSEAVIKNSIATFTDLSFNKFGSGFVLEFRSNLGHTVSLSLPICFFYTQ